MQQKVSFALPLMQQKVSFAGVPSGVALCLLHQVHSEGKWAAGPRRSWRVGAALLSVPERMVFPVGLSCWDQQRSFKMSSTLLLRF